MGTNTCQLRVTVLKFIHARSLEFDRLECHPSKWAKKRYQEMINYPVTLVPFKLNALQTFHVFAFQLITADVI